MFLLLLVMSQKLLLNDRTTQTCLLVSSNQVYVKKFFTMHTCLLYVTCLPYDTIHRPSLLHGLPDSTTFKPSLLMPSRWYHLWPNPSLWYSGWYHLQAIPFSMPSLCDCWDWPSGPSSHHITHDLSSVFKYSIISKFYYFRQVFITQGYQFINRIIPISRDDLIALAINLIKSKVCFFVVNCIRKNCEWQRNRQGEKNLSLPIRKDS